MNVFRQATLRKQKKVLEEKIVKVEKGMSKEGPLAKIFEHGGAVPYFVAGVIWRGLRQHLGVTKKDAEAAWKVEWNKEFKEKYEVYRKDKEGFKSQLDVDSMIWMEEVWQKMDGRRIAVENELSGIVVEEAAPVEHEPGPAPPSAPIAPIDRPSDELAKVDAITPPFLLHYVPDFECLCLDVNVARWLPQLDFQKNVIKPV